MNIRAKSRTTIRTVLTLSLLMWSLVGLTAVKADDEVKVTRESFRRLYCMGENWKIPVYNTTDSGIVMLKADHRVLSDIARSLGRDLNWSVEEETLTGLGGLSLGVGQTSLKIGSQQIQLPIAPQNLSGAIHVPTNALEQLLDCNITVKNGSRGSIYVEPLLDGITFSNEKKDSVSLHIRTTLPIRKKVFKLSNPDRTVIDLVGVAVPKDFEDAYHEVLGDIRVGQFKSAPSVARIVIPTGGGVKLAAPKSLDLFEHKILAKWPASKGFAQVRQAKVAKATPPKRPATVKPVAPKVGENADRVVRVPSSKPKRTQLLAAKWEGEKLRLTFDKPVSYRWSRMVKGKNRFIVDFPDVIFPKRRQTLNSSVAGLKLVRIVQNMPEPRPIVRMVCDLQSPLEVLAAGQNERELVLEFPGRKIAQGGFNKGFGRTQSAAKGNYSGGRTICLDAGHGGSDPGALNRSVGVTESQVTLDITRRLARILKSQGWNVIMTRESDRDVSWAGSSAKQELGARAKTANQFDADLFVSIHANASVKTNINGTSIHWYKSSDYQLARYLQSGVMSGTGRKNRGLIKNRFYVLAHTQMPAVLIETAFLTNPKEGKLLASPVFRERVAQGIASGLTSYAAYAFPNTAAKN